MVNRFYPCWLTLCCQRSVVPLTRFGEPRRGHPADTGEEKATFDLPTVSLLHSSSEYHSLLALSFQAKESVDR